MGSGRLLMPSSIGEEMIYMAELREAHLRYLLAIYELGRNDPDVGIQAVAKSLNCTKASVTKMMGVLMDMGLLNMPVFNPPYVGVFLEGYLVNLDWRTIVVNAIQMLGSIALWYPFFKLYEKRELENEKAVEAQKSAISAEDEALLNDLDLDF